MVNFHDEYRTTILINYKPSQYGRLVHMNCIYVLKCNYSYLTSSHTHTLATIRTWCSHVSNIVYVSPYQYDWHFLSKWNHSYLIRVSRDLSQPMSTGKPDLSNTSWVALIGYMIKDSLGAGPHCLEVYTRIAILVL